MELRDVVPDIIDTLNIPYATEVEVENPYREELPTTGLSPTESRTQALQLRRHIRKVNSAEANTPEERDERLHTLVAMYQGIAEAAELGKIERDVARAVLSECFACLWDRTIPSVQEVILGFVVRYPEHRDDLYNFARVRVDRCARNYDPSARSFGIYARMCVRNELLRYVRDNILTFRSRSNYELVGKIIELEKEGLSIEKIAAELGVDPERVKNVRDPERDLSFQSNISEEVITERALSGQQTIDEGLVVGDLIRRLKPVELALTNPNNTKARREKNIDYARQALLFAFGIDIVNCAYRPEYIALNQTEIAQRMGISQVHTSRLMIKLRNAMGEILGKEPKGYIILR